MSNSDFWYVMLQDGDVHRVTLDQLDEAFQAGHIDEETLVLASGARSWTPLGRLAGLEESHPVPFAPVETPFDTRVSTPVTSSVRPVSVDLTEVDMSDLAPPGGGRAKKWAVATAVAACAATLIAVAVQQPGLAQSTARNATGFAGRAAGALRAAGVAVEQRFTGAPKPQIDAPRASDPAAAPPPPVDATRTPTAPSPPAQQAAAASQPSEAATADRFAPDLKAKLLEADKQRETKHKSLLHFRKAGPSHAKTQFSGFTTGGNPFDPLNSGIHE